MKKRLQIILIHTIAGILIFGAALVFFNLSVTREKSNPVAELASATYPVIEIVSKNGDYNPMRAYRGEIDLSLVRNQVSLVGDSGTIDLKLYYYDYDITAIQYTLFKDNPEDPLEEGTLNQLTDDSSEKSRRGTIRFNTDLKSGETYFLRMAVRLSSSIRVWYYTRIMEGASWHVDEYIDFAREFHEMLFDKEQAVENIGVYLETDSSARLNSLEHVDIHSSSDVITYGSMTVKEEQEPRIKIREINRTYAVVELDTVLSSEIRADVVQYYDVREIYKMKYNPERMYLLDYNRYMDARYTPEFIDSSSNYLGLGIQSADRIDYAATEDGYRLAFCLQGQLWYYNYKSSDAARVYSFYSENLSDLRNDQEEHGIRILSMDEDGNITYLVYGYMNRGHHEGENGIQILYYKAEEKCNEEIAFLATSIPYNTIDEDIKKLSYLNDEGIFYCLLDGDFHEINLKEKTDTILKSGLSGEGLTASRDMSIIAMESEQDVTANREVQVLSLNDGSQRSYQCEETERIRAVGFLNKDFIYGIADQDDISRQESGAVVFPVSRLHIVDMEGREVKEYRKKGLYITNTVISGSVLEMEFARKSGNRFVQAEDTDYIRYKEDESMPVTLTTKRSDTYGEQIYFSFPDYVYIQIEPDLLLTKFRSSEDDPSLSLARSSDQGEEYYVYAGGEKKNTYSNLPDAVIKASQLRGNVMDNHEKILWQCAFDEYDIVAGMDQVVKVSSEQLSLAGCLSMIARLNGKSMSVDEIDRKPGMPGALLELCTGHRSLTLTGCSLDDVLYYINQGTPVIGKYSEKRYVVVMSYNSTKVRYLDPVTGLSTVEGRSELAGTFNKQGNVFYSYLSE
ncbi:MAG: hypothetical protein IJ137_04225 [Eubacterium sp.]|nr:hypothetical protein [Eubacterium sp.]